MAGYFIPPDSILDTEKTPFLDEEDPLTNWNALEALETPVTPSSFADQNPFLPEVPLPEVQKAKQLRDSLFQRAGTRYSASASAPASASASATLPTPIAFKLSLLASQPGNNLSKKSENKRKSRPKTSKRKNQKQQKRGSKRSEAKASESSEEYEPEPEPELELSEVEEPNELEESEEFVELDETKRQKRIKKRKRASGKPKPRSKRLNKNRVENIRKETMIQLDEDFLLLTSKLVEKVPFVISSKRSGFYQETVAFLLGDETSKELWYWQKDEDKEKKGVGLLARMNEAMEEIYGEEEAKSLDAITTLDRIAFRYLKRQYTLRDSCVPSFAEFQVSSSSPVVSSSSSSSCSSSSTVSCSMSSSTENKKTKTNNNENQKEKENKSEKDEKISLVDVAKRRNFRWKQYLEEHVFWEILEALRAEKFKQKENEKEREKRDMEAKNEKSKEIQRKLQMKFGDEVEFWKPQKFFGKLKQWKKLEDEQIGLLEEKMKTTTTTAKNKSSSTYTEERQSVIVQNRKSSVQLSQTDSVEFENTTPNLDNVKKIKKIMAFLHQHSSTYSTPLNGLTAEKMKKKKRKEKNSNLIGKKKKINSSVSIICAAILNNIMFVGWTEHGKLKYAPLDGLLRSANRFCLRNLKEVEYVQL